MPHNRGTPVLAPVVEPLYAILHHALGLHYAGPCMGLVEYRTHFVTGPGSKDFDHCRALVELGLMVDHGPQPTMRGDHLFNVTAKGREVGRSTFPKRPKLTRSQLRYRAFLDAERTEWAEGLA